MNLKPGDVLCCDGTRWGFDFIPAAIRIICGNKVTHVAMVLSFSEVPTDPEKSAVWVLETNSSGVRQFWSTIERLRKQDLSVTKVSRMKGLNQTTDISARHAALNFNGMGYGYATILNSAFNHLIGRLKGSIPDKRYFGSKSGPICSELSSRMLDMIPGDKPRLSGIKPYECWEPDDFVNRTDLFEVYEF